MSAPNVVNLAELRLRARAGVSVWWLPLVFIAGAALIVLLHGAFPEPAVCPAPLSFGSAWP